MTAYYNEFDPKAAAWLRELIADGLVARGEVDERSIVDVAASDLKGFSQHHFFAGIAGWSYALRLAGWPDDRPVWTASLPCQPFSAAGKGLGKQDERHLLPHFISLVAQCRPTVLFGEQVSAAIKHGWLDDLYTEMEANHYAVGSVVIGAHSIGAAHIRQRLYWVADNSGTGRKEQPCERRIPRKENDDESRKNAARSDGVGDSEHDGHIAGTFEGSDGSTIPHSKAGEDSTGESEGASASAPIPGYIRLPNTTSERCGEARSDSVRSEERTAGSNDGLHDSESERRAVCDSKDVRPTDGKVDALADSSRSVNEQSSFMQTAGVIGMADTSSERECADELGSDCRNRVKLVGSEQRGYGSDNGEIDWIYCRDNKYRPVESGTQPLVNGVPRGMVHSSDPFHTQEARTVRLKGYGNAIVPTLAAEFIKAYMQCKK